MLFILFFALLSFVYAEVPAAALTITGGFPLSNTLAELNQSLVEPKKTASGGYVFSVLIMGLKYLGKIISSFFLNFADYIRQL